MNRDQLKDNMYLNSNAKYDPTRKCMNYSLRAKLFSMVYVDTILTNSNSSSMAPDVDRVTGCRALDDEKYLYRLGDYYNYIINCNSVSKVMWMSEQFPGSLISMFVELIDDHDNIKSKEKKFLNLLKSRIQSEHNEAKLHLRTGDILSISRHIGKEWRMYTPIEKFKRVANRLVEMGCDSITIFSGTHENLGPRDSQVEAHLNDMVDEMYNVGNVFTQYNLEVKYHSSDADSDLLSMLSGDTFIPTQGEYSALIAKYARLLNKTVIMDARS